MSDASIQEDRFIRWRSGSSFDLRGFSFQSLRKVAPRCDAGK